MKNLIAIALLCLCVGCERPKVEAPVDEGHPAEWVPNPHIPKDATNVEDLGNGWFRFDLVISGHPLNIPTTQRFMFKHVQYDQRNPSGHITTVEYEVCTKL